MSGYSIIKNGDYWELHDGTMFGNGDPMPLLAGKDKIKIVLKTIEMIMDNTCTLYIHDQSGRTTNRIEFQNKR
jgi:hypothetical protein